MSSCIRQQKRNRTGAPVQEVKIVVVEKLREVQSPLSVLREVAGRLLLTNGCSLALSIEYTEVVLITLLRRRGLGLVREDLGTLRSSISISGNVRLLAGALSNSREVGGVFLQKVMV